MAILIFSRPGDLHTHAVEWALRAKGVQVEKVFMPDFPQLATISCSEHAEEIVFKSAGRRIRYGDYDTIWFRRPASPMPRGDLTPGDMSAATRSWNTLTRFLMSYPDADTRFCVNPPELFSLRDNKAFQIRLAARCGLKVPRTLISNDADDIRRFIERNRSDGSETIVKPLVPTLWREPDGTGHVLGVATVTAEALALADVRSEPLIFQRREGKAFEVRVTVMGASVLGVRIDSQGDAASALDFRNASDWRALGNESIDLPPTVRKQVRAICTALQTGYSTMDFIVSPEGEWIFLESNTAGNFLWMEDCNPRLPLLDCFAEYLLSRDNGFDYDEASTDRHVVKFREIADDPGFRPSIEKELASHVEFKVPFEVSE